jgi:hypothetical protein
MTRQATSGFQQVQLAELWDSLTRFLATEEGKSAVRLMEIPRIVAPAALKARGLDRLSPLSFCGLFPGSFRPIEWVWTPVKLA